jgi:NAD(P)-dependent dehydrogenase (short-subunit alcohol dehydrogenase family)
MEAGPHGVRANVICPGGVYDEGLRRTLERIAVASGVTAEEVERSILERTPLRKFASLEETARVALFLASNDSSHITGESINVSGGYIMH